MEHPIFFINAILSALGLEHFAHHYTHVTHAWLVMLILLGSALLFVRKIQFLPAKAQNFFEVLIEGLRFGLDLISNDLILIRLGQLQQSLQVQYLLGQPPPVLDILLQASEPLHRPLRLLDILPKVLGCRALLERLGLFLHARYVKDTP